MIKVFILLVKINAHWDIHQWPSQRQKIYVFFLIFLKQLNPFKLPIFQTLPIFINLYPLDQASKISINSFIYIIHKMNNESFARSLLYSIAGKINRRREDMQPFIRKLQAEWCDSREALAALTPNDYQRMQIPGGLASMIAEAVNEKPGKERGERMDVQSPAEDFLYTLSQRCPQDRFAATVETLTRIFTNIRENLIDEKYRTLKKTNQKVAQLAELKEAVQLLRFGGFEEVSPGFVLRKINISLIDQCLDSLAKFAPKIKFDPYQSHISSIGSTTIQAYQGESSVEYNEKLAELEKYRQSIMSKPIKNRGIRVYQAQPSIQAKLEQQGTSEEKETTEDERIYMENMKQILKRQGEDPKFMNRRKQEYFDLVKKPVFSETLIRVKLQDNWIFECRFSPLETLQSLVSIFQESLQNKNFSYYLYMTPPVQKIAGVIMRKTFDDLGCVPQAIFYFKCQENLQGNIFKVKPSVPFGL